MMSSSETIVAIATPHGSGGVGIVRVSGCDAYRIALSITHAKVLKPRLASFKSFYQDNDLIDQGVVLYFKAPHSFTGEDVIEFQAHGSVFILNRLLDACVSHGARLAKPGEFSLRAFLNDKIDLAQAEAIADLISAASYSSSRLALRSLQGDFSREVHQINQAIVHLRMYVEAAIDFPEEEIDFLSDGKVEKMLEDVTHNLIALRNSAHQGALLREGGIVVIAGPPNAGKSTLINALSGNDIAIVTAVPGTTRDVMREHILIDDLPLQIIDTAGLRDTDDVVELEGIRRAWHALGQADCVLLVSPVGEVDASLSDKLTQHLPPHVPILHVINKIDETTQSARREENHIYLSAKEKIGLSLLKESIKETLGYRPTEGIFMARQRHLDALSEAYQFLKSGAFALKVHRAGELLAQDLHQAHLALCAITGEFTSDDLLGEIFSSFCIGK